MLKKFLSILLVVGLAGAGTYFYLQNQQSSPNDNTLIGYYLLAQPGTPNSVSFEGCGDDFLLKSGAQSTTLEGVLNELFTVHDPSVTSLTNSDIQVVVTDHQIDLQGTLISAGTCDTPRITNQIIYTVADFFAPDEEFTITLNGSEQEFRCFGDQSDFCE